MFCTSLRKRPEWATVPTALLSSQTLRWKEQSLDTHDLAIPIPNFHDADELDMFRLLVLSSSDLEASTPTMARVQRLYHHTGGRNIGIVFLLNEKVPKSNGIIAFMNLQINLLSTCEMPIMPLASISTLQDTLSGFQRQLVTTRKAAVIPKVNAVTALLPFCTNNPPLPEHAKIVLSDICHGIPDVARAATTRDGQQALRQWLEDANADVAGDVVHFWAREVFLY